MSNANSNIKKKTIDDMQKTNKFKKKFKKNESSKLFLVNRSKIKKLYIRNNLQLKNVPQISQSIESLQKNNKSKVILHPFGPYSNLFSDGGGFYKRILGKKNVNQYKKNETLEKNFTRNQSMSKFELNNKKNNISRVNKTNKTMNHSKSNKKINLKKNFKNSITKKNKENKNNKKINKINIKEVYQNIKYLKLNKDSPINNNEINTKEKEEKIQQENEKINPIIKSNSKSLDNKDNNHNKKSREETIQNNELTNNKTLIKQISEQFSMKNTKIRKFNKLSVDNILLNYYPSFNIPHKNKFNTTNSLSNYSISYNQIEYKIIKGHNNLHTLDENKKQPYNINDISKITSDKIISIKNKKVKYKEDANDMNIPNINGSNPPKEDNNNMNPKKVSKKFIRFNTKMIQSSGSGLKINGDNYIISKIKKNFKHMKTLNIDEINKQKIKEKLDSNF